MARQTSHVFQRGINKRVDIERTDDPNRLYTLQNARLFKRGETGYVSRIEGYKSILNLESPDIGDISPPLPDSKVLDFNVDVTYFPTLAVCSWSAVEDVDGYNVYLKSNGEFVKQNVELIVATEYDIEGLEGGNYESYVTFVQGGVESDPSDIEEFEVNLVIVSSGLSTSDVTASSESFDGNRMSVFNETNFLLWVADTWQNEWVRIDFGEQIEVLYVIHRNGTELGTPKEWKIQGSNDDSTWDDLLVVEQSERVAADEPHELPITGMYRYYRLFVTESWDDENVIRVRNTRLFAIE